MRWYELDPDVCMAISMIECSEKPKQIKYAEEIISLLKEKDIEMEYIKNYTENYIQNRHKRWYDCNDTISKAFEYLKSTTKELQKEISLSILSLINSNNIDNAIKSL